MPAGRPTKKTEFSLKKIIELTKAGKTVAQIAELMDLAPVTIQKWIEQDYEYAVTVREAKLEADEMIEKALYDRAHGFTKTVKEQRVGENGETNWVDVEKYFPPDAQALKFWLMNRQREKWTERASLELAGKDGQPLELIVKDYRSDKK